MGLQRLLTDDRQAVTTATATSVKPSSAIERTAVSRQGNGRINLTGPYTGGADTDIDVEITSGGANRITRPSFSGVGSGEMTDLAVLAGATPQKWTMTLIDLGVDTATAETEIEGVILRALVAGSAGNSINMTVDQSGIVETPSNFSLIDPLSAGVDTVTGVEFDWDTAVGTESTIPASAKRLRIGNDSTIYRQWKYYQEGEWKYRFMPEVGMDHPAGAKVSFITGSRSVTITDGVTPESYSGVVTLYDLLAQIRDTPSALVEVVGVISPDLIVDNPQAVLDLRTRTDAHVESTSGEGSKYATGFTDYAALASASTELVTAECYAVAPGDGAGVGREKWKLSGSVSGDLGTLITDILYTEAGKFTLRIPKYLPDGYSDGDNGDITASVSYADRASGNPPAICVDALQLGPDAQDMSISWVYTKRPTLDCPCENVAYTKLPGTCLDDEAVAAITDPEYVVRAEMLAAYRKQQPGSTAIDEVYNRLLSLLVSIFAGVTSWSAWTASGAYAEGDAIESGEYKYRAKVAGTSGASAPTFPASIGEEVTDGTVTWVCISRKPLPWWDAVVAQVHVEVNDDGSIHVPVIWSLAQNCPNTLPVGELVRIVSEQKIDASNYKTVTVMGKVTTAGTLGTEPEYTSASTITRGDAITNTGGTAVLEVDNAICASVGSPTCPTLVNMPNYVCGTSRMYGDYPLGDKIYDYVSHGNITEYLDRYELEMLTAAEVAPNWVDPGDINECWPDPGGDYWWVPSDEKYLPAFTNLEYHSVKGTHENVVPTHEFGFVIKVASDCIDSLVEGDSVTITIGDAGCPPTYQVGDRLYLSTIASGALDLIGGVDGTDELTFQVDGSTDGLTADYVVDKASPALYDNGQIQARIIPGGIDYALGDVYSFCVESGQFRWRQDGGAWSAAADIGTNALVDGLSVSFDEGACPSFVAGDTASFTAYQPHAVSQAQHPDDGRYALDGTGTVITLPTTGNVDTLAIGMHSLPSSATVSVTDGTDTWPMTVRYGVMVLLFDPVLSAPTLTITVANAAGADIGWLWAGQALSFNADARNNTRKMGWAMNRGTGVRPSATRVGSSNSWAVTWEGWITKAEADSLYTAIDAHKAGGDWPAVFIPSDLYPEYASMVWIPDEIEMDDFNRFVHPGEENINFSMELNGWVF